MFEQGDLVILPVPFTDFAATKKRPAIVLSNNQFNSSSEDVVVVAVTSNPTRKPFSLDLCDSDLKAGKLPKPSKIKADKIFCASQKIILKKFAKIKPELVGKIRLEILKIL